MIAIRLPAVQHADILRREPRGIARVVELPLDKVAKDLFAVLHALEELEFFRR